MPLCPDAQSLILIVDDTPANLTVISEVLSGVGFEIAIATTGERALEQVHRDPPDLILLDVMMPGIGGFETCRRLKADPSHQDIPVIFMTALSDTESKVEGLSLGAVDYITKPFQEQEVVARVKTHLDLRKTQLKLKVSEARLSSILGSLQEVVWSAYLDPFELLYLNPAVETIYGLSPEVLLAQPQLWLDQIEPSDRVLMDQQLTNSLGNGSLDLEYRVLGADGGCRWVHCQATISPGQDNQRCRLDGIVQDISERKKAENRLLYAAQHDSLTHLSNRSYFTEQLGQLLKSPRDRRSDKFALLFIDLDRFKTINDSLGHGIGDELLVRVGQILQDSIRPTDLVARLGGDEFTILLNGVSTSEEVITVSDRIQHQLKSPLLIGEHRLNISASIGIVIDSQHYSSAEDILRDADIAMYQAKSLGKACHQLFSPEMYIHAMHKLRLEDELKNALDKQEFFLQYQPIKQLDTGELKGFEALVRWQHPSRGLVAPSEFIPLAEESGLIVKLGEYVLQEACMQMQRWQQSYPEANTLTVSVNLSSCQLRNATFLESLDNILRISNLNPANLKLEITESILMENSDITLQILQFLQDRGICLSLDDFGTGYSSLSYLHRFPIQTIKIDRSFVQTMESGLSSFEIVRTITSLAKNLCMDVVAEGVETEQQAQYLRTMDCEMVQGYFFSKPLSVEAATQFIQQQLSCPMG